MGSLPRMRFSVCRWDWSACFVFVIFWGSLVCYAGELPTVHIGAILEENDLETEQAFRSAVELVNSEPGHALTRFRLAGVVQRVAPHDAFHAHKAVCKLLSLGVMAVVGPSSPSGSASAGSACARSRVPHLVTLDQDTDQDSNSQDSPSMSISLSPERGQLGMALADLVTLKGWTSFTLVYEDSRGEKGLLITLPVVPG